MKCERRRPQLCDRVKLENCHYGTGYGDAVAWMNSMWTCLCNLQPEIKETALCLYYGISLGFVARLNSSHYGVEAASTATDVGNVLLMQAAE